MVGLTDAYKIGQLIRGNNVKLYDDMQMIYNTKIITVEYEQVIWITSQTIVSLGRTPGV